MKKLILTMGLPRSGKSTWAKEQGLPIVNPDSIRLALHGKAFISDSEPMVWVLAKYMVKSLFLAGHEKVIVDATNLTYKRRKEWHSKEWEINVKAFDTTKEECIKRAVATKREDLIPIIERMYESSKNEEMEECIFV